MLIAWDYETHLISPEHPYPKPVCVSSFNGWNKKIVVSNEADDTVGSSSRESNLCHIESHVSFILDNVSVAHNATFELGVTWAWFPDLRPKIKLALAEGRVICTQVLQGILNSRIKNPPKRNSLSALVKLYFDEDISESKKNPDAWRLRYSELDGVPLKQWPQEAIDYSISDSVWAFKVYKILQKEGISVHRAVEASFYLNQIGKIGLKVDQSRVKTLEDEIYSILNPKYEFLIEKGFCTKTLGKRPKKNMKILREYIKEIVQEPVLSKKGNIQTDLEAMMNYYAETEDEVLKAFLDIAEYDKVITSYLSHMKGAEKIMSDYSTDKSTGRTSCKGSSLYPSMNVQQMPRKVSGVTWDVRNCFVPREGYKMVSIDYSGLELASAATQLKKCFGKSAMLDLLNSGVTPVDPHSMLAAKIMNLKGDNIQYSTFVEHKKEEPYCHMRQLCKFIGLGFPGGIGYDVIRKQLLVGGIKTKYGRIETSKDENYLRNLCYKLKPQEPNIRVKQVSKDEFALVYDEIVGLKKDMFKVYPDLERFLSDYHSHATTGETWGHYDEFGQWEEEPMYKYQCKDFQRDWCNYTAYCNGFLMQTPAAIGATTTAINLGREYLGHPEVNLLAFIHDEFLFEVKADKLHHVKDIGEMMIDGMKSVLKGVRIAVEANVMDYWSKDGENPIVYWKDAESTTLRSKQ